MLTKQGHRVRIADNGKKALELLAAEGFALVLMDVQMPEMDGFEATTVLRARESATGKHTPVIAMTAHALKGDRERCLENGMDGYVSKPIIPDDLWQEIATVLGAIRAGKEAQQLETLGQSGEIGAAAEQMDQLAVEFELRQLALERMSP